MKKLMHNIGKQAQELMKNEIVSNKLKSLKTEEEKKRWLAVAAIYALTKANE